MPLIILEGIDGCGKTTQLNLLRQHYIKKHKDKICFYRAPGTTAVGEKIRKILLTPGNKCTKEAELHLFLAALVQTTTELIIPALAEKKFVFLDRYYYSTIAYQIYGLKFEHKNFYKMMIENTIRHILGPVEKVVFYFDLPVKTALERRKEEPNDRIEKRGKNFLERVLEGYHAQLEHFVLVDATHPPAQIYKDIKEYVSKWKV